MNTFYFVTTSLVHINFDLCFQTYVNGALDKLTF